MRVKLLYRSSSPRLQQLYTGFAMLHRQGVVRLVQARWRDRAIHGTGLASPDEDSPAQLDALVHYSEAGRRGRLVRLHFDTEDGDEVALGELDVCDVYFKRSYRAARIDELPEQHRCKVFPLGLNFEVLPDSIDGFELARRVTLAGGARQSVLSALGAAFAPLFGARARSASRPRPAFRPRLSLLQSPPAPDLEPRVLFLAAAYDPRDSQDPRDPQDLDRESIDQRFSLNEMRARCIALLRKELGPRFLGGFVPDRFARERYGKLLATEGLTAREQYFEALRRFPICIATTGLHGTIGWKLAEYVAFSRAILCEPLPCQLPGGFAAGTHYLPFTRPEECVAQAQRLIANRDLRAGMMASNAEYYRAHVRPDSLVLHALVTARAWAAAEALTAVQETAPRAASADPAECRTVPTPPPSL